MELAARITGTKLRSRETYDAAVTSGASYERLIVGLMLDLRARSIDGFGARIAIERYTIQLGTTTAHLCVDFTHVDLWFLNVIFDSRNTPRRIARTSPHSFRCSLTSKRSSNWAEPMLSDLHLYVDRSPNAPKLLDDEYLAEMLKAADIPSEFFQALFAHVNAPRMELDGVFMSLTLDPDEDEQRPRDNVGALFELDGDRRSRGWILGIGKHGIWVATAQVNEPMLLVEAIDAPRQ
jgi:hypothetical protein